jgi:hypothetical protein
VLEAVRRDANRALSRPLLDREVRQRAIPERELKARFELRQDEWTQPTRVRIRELRVTPEPGPAGLGHEDDATDATRAEDKIRRLHERAAAGESFDELARRYSEAPSSRYGGLIGWVVEGRFAAAYETAALGLQAGELSEPIPLEDGGWVLLFAEAREEARAVAFEDKREEVLRDLLREDPGALNRRYRVYVEELRDRHDVRIQPDSVREAFAPQTPG